MASLGGLMMWPFASCPQAVCHGAYTGYRRLRYGVSPPHDGPRQPGGQVQARPARRRNAPHTWRLPNRLATRGSTGDSRRVPRLAVAMSRRKLKATAHELSCSQLSGGHHPSLWRLAGRRGRLLRK